MPEVSVIAVGALIYFATLSPPTPIDNLETSRLVEPSQTIRFVSTQDAPAINNPADNAVPGVKKTEIDKVEFDRMRKSLRDAVKDTAEAKKVEAILAFGTNPEISKSPAAMKAVLAEALVQSLATKDLRNAQTTLRRIQDSAELFAENEYKASVSRVKDLAAANNEHALALELIDGLQERQLLTPVEAVTEKAAALNTAAQDKALKKPANQAQRQDLADEMLALAIAAAEIAPDVADDLLLESRKTVGAIVDREQRAAFDKELTAAKAIVAEVKRYQLALEQLKKDPQDVSAQKVRIDGKLNRGRAKEVLADIAKSEHPLQSLAKETVALLQQGAEAAGKPCFNCAQQWAKAAEESPKIKRIGLQELARELTSLAIAAEKDPLDPFAMQTAKQLEITIASNNPTVPATPPKTLTPKPATPKPNAAEAKFKTVDLLASGAKTTVVKGKLDKTKDAFVSERGLFEFDQELTERTYRLVVKFARTGGRDTIGFTIPVGTEAVTVVVGAYNNTIHGLSDVDRSGPDQSQNKTGVGGVIENNRAYTAQIDVQQVTETDYHIVVLLDGAKIIDWQGAQNRLVPSGGTEYAATSRRKIAAGATKSTLEVRTFELSVPAALGKTTPGKALSPNK